MSGLACDTLSGSHSADRVSVYYGNTEPARMCGKHSQYLTPQDWAELNGSPVTHAATN